MHWKYPRSSVMLWLLLVMKLNLLNHYPSRAQVVSDDVLCYHTQLQFLCMVLILVLNVYTCWKTGSPRAEWTACGIDLRWIWRNWLVFFQETAETLWLQPRCPGSSKHSVFRWSVWQVFQAALVSQPVLQLPHQGQSWRGVKRAVVDRSWL